MPCKMLIGYNNLVGAVAGAEVPEQQRVEDLQSILLKLPKIHLAVLDAIVEHLKMWREAIILPG